MADKPNQHRGRFARILLRKAKIERLPKSRESRCLDVSTAAMLARGDTKIRRRFCERRCGPSHRGERNASAVLKNFVRQPKKTFSTVSAISGRLGEMKGQDGFKALVFGSLSSRGGGCGEGVVAHASTGRISRKFGRTDFAGVSASLQR